MKPRFLRHRDRLAPGLRRLAHVRAPEPCQLLGGPRRRHRRQRLHDRHPRQPQIGADRPRLQGSIPGPAAPGRPGPGRIESRPLHVPPWSQLPSHRSATPPPTAAAASPSTTSMPRQATSALSTKRIAHRSKVRRARATHLSCSSAARKSRGEYNRSGQWPAARKSIGLRPDTTSTKGSRCPISSPPQLSVVPACRLPGLDFGSGHRRSMTDQEMDAQLNAVLDSGINFIDTANDYGNSEEMIGRYLRHRRDEYRPGHQVRLPPRWPYLDQREPVPRSPRKPGTPARRLPGRDATAQPVRGRM